MSSPLVRMYHTQMCPYCIRADRLLSAKGVQLEKIDASSHEVWQEMETVSRRSTVPQIFVGDLHLGGYDEIASLERAGQLDAILSGEVTSLD